MTQINAVKIKRAVPAVIIGILLLIIIYVFINSSLISIDVSGGSGGVSYKFQASNKVVVTTSTKTKLTKRLPKGDYEVTIKSGEKSYFTVVKTRGFFRTTRISANLVAENNREFISNNPSQCTNVINTTAISYQCGGTFGDIQVHVPATKTQASYLSKNPNRSINGYVEGLAHTKQGTVLLMRSFYSAQQEVRRGQYAELINDSLSVQKESELADTNPDGSYNIKPFRDGFIVYDNSYKKINYYVNMGSKPETINLPSAKTKGLQPVDISTHDGSIMVVYTNASGEHKNKGTVTELSVNIGGQEKNITLKLGLAQLQLCGTQKVCAVVDNQMRVFDISGNKAKFLYEVSGIKKITEAGNSELLVRNDEILRFDIDKRVGYISYSFGRYEFNSLETLSNNSYYLTATNSKGRKFGLVIDDKNDGNTIDKKIDELVRLVYVSEVSVYKNFIFISPNIGSANYNPVTGFYNYDQQTKNSANTAINNEIDRLGIDRNKYNIVINLLN